MSRRTIGYTIGSRYLLDVEQRGDVLTFYVVDLARDNKLAYALQCQGCQIKAGSAETPDPELLAFLRAHYDDLVDWGLPMDAWPLHGCLVCGADSFLPCRSLVGGHANKTIHQGRWDLDVADPVRPT